MHLSSHGEWVLLNFVWTLEKGLAVPINDIGRCELAQRFAITLMIIAIDKTSDSGVYVYVHTHAFGPPPSSLIGQRVDPGYIDRYLA